MGSLFGFDADGTLGALLNVVDLGSGAVTAATRQAMAQANLGLLPAGTTTQVTPGVVTANSVVIAGANGQISGLTINPSTVDATGATVTLTAAQNGAIVLLDRAAGTTVTLPAAVVGTKFTFIVKTVATSNAHKIITSAGTIFLTGGINFDKSLTVTRYDGDNSTNVSLNLNGTTTGGATIGDTFTMVCVTATSWTVEGTVTASGTLATPFATS